MPWVGVLLLLAGFGAVHTPRVGPGDSGNVPVVRAPVDATVRARPGSARNGVVFELLNPGSLEENYSLRCEATAAASQCALAAQATRVPAGRRVYVRVLYSAGAAGEGSVSLVATGASGSDRASYKVLVGEDPGDETAVSALGGGGGGAAPWIEIHPSVGTFGSANVPVSVHWCGNGGTLDASTRSIRLGATDVTGSFTYTTDPECGARSEGTVTLASGVNTLYADICNTNGLCGSGSAEYTYSAGSAPVVSLAPHAGSRINRPRCVISSAGPGAAFQCGELIAMHAMPTFTSRTARGIFSCFTTAPRPACSRW